MLWARNASTCPRREWVFFWLQPTCLPSRLFGFTLAMQLEQGVHTVMLPVMEPWSWETWGASVTWCEQKVKADLFRSRLIPLSHSFRMLHSGPVPAVYSFLWSLFIFPPPFLKLLFRCLNEQLCKTHSVFSVCFCPV